MILIIEILNGSITGKFNRDKCYARSRVRDYTRNRKKNHKNKDLSEENCDKILEE